MTHFENGIKGKQDSLKLKTKLTFQQNKLIKTKYIT